MTTRESEIAGFPPKVFLIGAQKAGTTFLANLLDQHPAISLAEPKEPHYFTKAYDRGLDWYRRCFPDEVESKILLDASPSYSAAPIDSNGEVSDSANNPYVGVPQRISEVAPDARFIYLVRDPVSRIHSGYWHAVRTGAERRPFREAIEPRSHYRRVSDYYGQIQLYLRHFSAEKILVIRFEDLAREPAMVISRCASFLGIDEPDRLDVREGRNRSLQYSGLGRAVDWVLTPVGGVQTVSKVGRMLPDSVRRPLERLITSPIPGMDVDLREELLEQYASMARRFHDVTGVKLYPWSANDSE